MRIGAILVILVASAVACSAPAPAVSVSAATPTVAPQQPSLVPSASVQPTAANTAAATFSVPVTFAAVCGTASDRIARTATTNATFLLNSPGRSPLKIASPGNAPIDAVVPGGYACLLLGAGVPFPILGGLIGPHDEGFLSEGTIPATSAKPTPTGFVLPQACAFVAAPVSGTDQTDWSIDCGAAKNSNARGTLGPALVQQGWALCASGLAAAQWRKGNVMLGVVESSLTPGEYMRLTQFAHVISPCS